MVNPLNRNPRRHPITKTINPYPKHAQNRPPINPALDPQTNPLPNTKIPITQNNVPISHNIANTYNIVNRCYKNYRN